MQSGNAVSRHIPDSSIAKQSKPTSASVRAPRKVLVYVSIIIDSLEGILRSIREFLETSINHVPDDHSLNAKQTITKEQKSRQSPLIAGQDPSMIQPVDWQENVAQAIDGDRLRDSPLRQDQQD